MFSASPPLYVPMIVRLLVLAVACTSLGFPDPPGMEGAAIGDAWRRHLSAVPPARIDLELRVHGCQTP